MVEENFIVLKKIKTSLQEMMLYETDDKQLLFTLDSFAQFKSGLDEEIYHRSLVDSALDQFPKDFSPSKILILGGGDGLVARNIFEKLKYPVCPILVDIDKELVNYFSTEQKLLELNKGSLCKCLRFYEDALNFVKQSDNKYHLIILDLPDPNFDKLKSLYEEEFYSNCSRLLEQGGIISLQVNYKIRHQIAEVFKNLLGNSKIIEYEMPWMGLGAIIQSKCQK